MDPDAYGAYREHRRRSDRRVWICAIVASIAAGYVVGRATDLLIGAVVTLLTLICQELVMRRVDMALWLRRFPELDYPGARWVARGWLLRSKVTTKGDRSAKPS